MEQCAPCGKEIEKAPVVGLMSVNGVRELEASTGRAIAVLGIDPAVNWAAIPICRECHLEPKIKAHYFRRGDEVIALRLADMHNLSVPKLG